MQVFSSLSPKLQLMTVNSGNFKSGIPAAKMTNEFALNVVGQWIQ